MIFVAKRSSRTVLRIYDYGGNVLFRLFPNGIHFASEGYHFHGVFVWYQTLFNTDQKSTMKHQATGYQSAGLSRHIHKRGSLKTGVAFRTSWCLPSCPPCRNCIFPTFPSTIGKRLVMKCTLIEI